MLYFEVWASKQRSYINTLAAQPLFPTVPLNRSYYGLTPITNFIDTDPYDGTPPSTSLTQGIAEYANANFFSDDTLFAAEQKVGDARHYFPYPKASSTNLQDYLDQKLLPKTIVAEDGQPDVSFWIAKVRDGEQIAHFVKPLYWTDDTRDGSAGEGAGNVSKLYGRLFYRDETCHADYAKHLIPRAVGYSAALIDYFFRGKITLEKAPTGSGYVVVNNTDEAMAGTFILTYNTTANRRKSLWSKTFSLGANNSGKHRSTPFDFAGPIDAKTPGEYVLVFNGTLGAESGAVVGALVQIPTVVVIHEGFYLQVLCAAL